LDAIVAAEKAKRGSKTVRTSFGENGQRALSAAAIWDADAPQETQKGMAENHSGGLTSARILTQEIYLVPPHGR
jgi:hypothetical protein